MAKTEAPLDARGAYIIVLTIIAAFVLFFNEAPAWHFLVLVFAFVSGFWLLCLAAIDYDKWRKAQAQEEKKDDLAG